MRLAAILVVAVLGADLAGFDCSRLAMSSSACPSSADGPDDACPESPDCLCCAVADATPETSSCAGSERIGPARFAPQATTVDGFRSVPYRPPLLDRLPSVL
jgi:hypothetical protein